MGSPEEKEKAPREREEGQEAAEEEEEDDKFVPGKVVSLKEQLELDKEDESLRKWKEQLLGNLSLQDDEGKGVPEVEVRAMRLLVEGREPVEIPIAAVLAEARTEKEKEKKGKSELHFVLKEKSPYRLQFEFVVLKDIVLGLTYLNRVFRLGVQVDKTKIMLGTYGPQKDPYKFDTEEEITPDGMLARGKYTAKTAFVDDDGRTYLEFDYTFEIKKDWT